MGLHQHLVARINQSVYGIQNKELKYIAQKDIAMGSFAQNLIQMGQYQNINIQKINEIILMIKSSPNISVLFATVYQKEKEGTHPCRIFPISQLFYNLNFPF
ncbi:unnamed protein product [Paramecium sonneborni]|uniref:Uncharacterized protein n=1 Tax=Paramecium sonneborni TaxID=65129 RepID=A0A8S1QK77_9CILI|nr:unnamed protein product [Paramecium sonneborni]